MSDTDKTQPAEGYPPEEGCYLQGYDFSAVAGCAILKWMREETPPEDIEDLVRVDVEAGAALSGTLQKTGEENRPCYRGLTRGYPQSRLGLLSGRANAFPRLHAVRPGSIPGAAFERTDHLAHHPLRRKSKNEGERSRKEKLEALMQRIRRAVEKRNR